MTEPSKAELKRQKAAAKLKPQIEKAALLLREYYSAHYEVAQEQGKELMRDDWRLRMAEQLESYSTLL